MPVHIVWPLVTVLAIYSAWTSHAFPSPTLDAELTRSHEETPASSEFWPAPGTSETLLFPTPSATASVSLSSERTADAPPHGEGKGNNSTAVVAGVCSGIAVAFLLSVVTPIAIYIRRKKRHARLAAETNSHEDSFHRMGGSFNPFHGNNKEAAHGVSEESNCEFSVPTMGGRSVMEEEPMRRDRELEVPHSSHMHQRRNMAPDAVFRLHCLRHRETADAAFGPFQDSDDDLACAYDETPMHAGNSAQYNNGMSSSAPRNRNFAPPRPNFGPPRPNFAPLSPNFAPSMPNFAPPWLSHTGRL